MFETIFNSSYSHLTHERVLNHPNVNILHSNLNLKNLIWDSAESNMRSDILYSRGSTYIKAITLDVTFHV